MKSTLTVPMPPITGGFSLALSTNSSSESISELPLTSSARSSVASSAMGVKSLGLHGVSACSGVVMKLPLVVEIA